MTRATHFEAAVQPHGAFESLCFRIEFEFEILFEGLFCDFPTEGMGDAVCAAIALLPTVGDASNDASPMLINIFVDWCITIWSMRRI